MKSIKGWERYKTYLNVNPEIGLMVDISRMRFPKDYFDCMEPKIQKAFQDMEAMESGAIANPDEKRMVGHYWLRAPEWAPERKMTRDIKKTLQAIKDFSQQVHAGRIKSQKSKPFSRMLIIGIGGSALGPQWVSDALTTSKDPIKPYFFDNTDPDGFDRVLKEIKGALSETMTIVISKSGSTIETRNGIISQKDFVSKNTLLRLLKPIAPLTDWRKRKDGSRGSRCGIGWGEEPQKPLPWGFFLLRSRELISMDS